MNFIENKEELGIAYDWRAIRREYDKLGIPEGYYQIPWRAIENGNKYIVPLSERSTGKTTNWLLVGLCMHKLYGTVIQYVRATEDQLKPSHADKLTEVIRTYEGGEYIHRLTGGRYNSIYYRWKQFYYCFVDETGEITEKSTVPIIQFLSVDKHEDYKSSYNAPRGDLVLFDEFIGKYYRPDEAIHFFDLTKTIIRDRRSPLIVLCANTINLNSMYFEELEISRAVRQLRKGDARELVTAYGTKIYVEIIDLIKKEKRSIVNQLFYGFQNPKLAAITGGEVWAFEAVPHIPRSDEKVTFARNLYIEAGLELLQLEIAYTPNEGTHLEVHRATRTYEDSVILTLGELRDTRYMYGLGNQRISAIVSKYLFSHTIYYSSNEVGSTFKDYVNRYRLGKNSI